MGHSLCKKLLTYVTLACQLGLIIGLACRTAGAVGDEPSVPLDGQSTAQPSDEEQIRHLIEAFDQAIENGDIDASVAPYAQDAHSFPLLHMMFRTSEERLEAVRQAVASTEGRLKIERDNLEIHVRGDLAWAAWMWKSGRWHEGKLTRPPLLGRTTFILQKLHGEWKVIHSHISTPLQLPTAESQTRR